MSVNQEHKLARFFAPIKIRSTRSFQIKSFDEAKPHRISKPKTLKPRHRQGQLLPLIAPPVPAKYNFRNREENVS